VWESKKIYVRVSNVWRNMRRVRTRVRENVADKSEDICESLKIYINA